MSEKRITHNSISLSEYMKKILFVFALFSLVSNVISMERISAQHRSAILKRINELNSGFEFSPLSGYPSPDAAASAINAARKDIQCILDDYNMTCPKSLIDLEKELRSKQGKKSAVFLRNSN